MTFDMHRTIKIISDQEKVRVVELAEGEDELIIKIEIEYPSLRPYTVELTEEESIRAEKLKIGDTFYCREQDYILTDRTKKEAQWTLLV